MGYRKTRFYLILRRSVFSKYLLQNQVIFSKSFFIFESLLEMSHCDVTLSSYYTVFDLTGRDS